MKKDTIDIEKLDEAYSKIQESQFHRYMNPKEYIKAPSIITEKNIVGKIPEPYYFREHRGSLEESLETTISCHCGIISIIEYYEKIYHPHPCPYTNIYIQDKVIIDERLPIWWGEKEYPVVASSNEDGSARVVTLGYCNFK